MTIAFVDGRVIVGDGRMIENATVMVEDGKILKIAQSSKNIPKDFQKISFLSSLPSLQPPCKEIRPEIFPYPKP